MGRKPCCEKEGVNRGAWTPREDRILMSYIKTHGEGKWMTLPKEAGLKRCGKSCRLRWLNYLRPDIKRGNISEDEDDLIIRLHKLLGNRWSLIAGRLPGRTDNEIKNYWNTNLSKRVHGQPSQQVKPMPSAKSIEKDPITEPAKIDPSPPEAPTEAQLIRTKATRCKRAFFHLDQHHISYPQRQDSVVNLGRNGSFDDVGMDVDSTVRAIEFDVGEGIQVGGHSMREDDSNTSLGVPSGDPALLDELALEDWLTRECFELEPDITVDFQSLASFLLNDD